MSPNTYRYRRAGKIQHVVWDWNGTLLDDTPACVEALNAILAWQRRPPVSEAQYRQTFTFPVQDYYRSLGLPCSGALWDDLTRLFHRHYAVASSRAPLRQGIDDLLKTLHGGGMPMSVLSACESTILERMIGERGIRHCFKHVYGLNNLDAHSKLETGQALMATLNLPPSSVLLIGDTLHDFEVASELQCACMLLSEGHQSTDRLQSCGCPVAAAPETVLDFIVRAN